MIAAEYEPALESDHRRGPRAPVALDVRFGHTGFHRTLCKVANVSLHGAKLHTYSSLKQGAMIWLTLPRIGQVIAKIIWADDYEAGCQFMDPLDDHAFAALVGANAEYA